MPDCTRYEELCSASLDNALSKEEKQELEAHLAECPACRAYMEDLRAMKTLWKGLEIEAPEGLHERIMGQITQEMSETVVQMPAKQRRRPPVFTMLAAAAACVLLAVTGNLNGLFSKLDNTVPMTQNNVASSDLPSTADAGAADGTSPAASNPDDGNDAAAARIAPESDAEPGGDDTQINEGAGVPAVPPAPQTPAQPDEGAKKPEQTTPNPPQQKDNNGEAGTAPANIAPYSGMEGRSAPGGDAPMLLTPALIMPEALAEMQFANCYRVTGPGEMPVIDGMTLLLSEDGVSYYALENNESKIEAARKTLESEGFQTALYEPAPANLQQREAEEVLIVFSTAQS